MHNDRQLWRYIPSAAFLLLGLHLATYADPISGTTALIISLAVSAAGAVGSYVMQRMMAPKPKPQDKNKLQGDIQLTTVGEDIPIPEHYGRSLGDGKKGGTRAGGIIFYCSQIIDVVTQEPGERPSGGKGGPKPPANNVHHYYVDLAIMFGIWGPFRIRQIKAQDDVLYQDFTMTEDLTGTTYEAENPTSHSGTGFSTSADPDFSGLTKATLQPAAWLQWNNVSAADDAAPLELYIVYRSTADRTIDLTVNGVTSPVTLPNSFGLRANVNFPQTLSVGSSNTVRITNTSAAEVDLDRIVVGFSTIEVPAPGEDCFLSGVIDPNYTNPEPTYDYRQLRDPLLEDPRGCQQYNYQANPNTRGEIDATISGGGLRIYPGNKTQLPDPMLQAYFEAKYGPGSTPAFRNRGYFVLDHFEITRYRTVPNFTVVVEHVDINSLGEMYEARCLRAGLKPAEIDFNALKAVPLRGYPITSKQSPTKEIELTSRIFDVDVYQGYNGIVTGVIPSDTPTVAIPASELGATELNDSASSAGGEQFKPVEVTERDESDIPYFFEASYFDPELDWETRNAHTLRESKMNDRKDNIETGMVMLETEANRFVRREHHRMYAEKDPMHVSLFHKYAYLVPTNLISVEDKNGSWQDMRIKSVEGWIPGAFDVRGVSRKAIEYPPRLFVTAQPPSLSGFSPPAPVVGTFIDLAILHEEPSPGFYIAAALTDQHYKWKGAGLYRKMLDSPDFTAIEGIPKQATMGRTITGGGSGTQAVMSQIDATPWGAWSVDKLNAAYTGPCMRIKDSVGAEMDLPFAADNRVDAAAATGTAPFYILKLYGQDGTHRDLPGDQGSGDFALPKLDVANRQIEIIGGRNFLIPDMSGFTAAHVFLRKKNLSFPAGVGFGAWWLFGTVTANGDHMPYDDGLSYSFFGRSSRRDSIDMTGITVTNYHTVTALSKPSKWYLRFNGVTKDSTTSNTPAFTASPRLGIGKADYSLYSEGHFTDFMIFTDEVSSTDLAAIEATLGTSPVSASGPGVLGDIPDGYVSGDWDDTNSVTFDLFYDGGGVESFPDAEIISNGLNFYVVGDEIIQAGTLTRVNGYPNRWAASHLQRGLYKTAGGGHSAHDRVVLFNNAWQFVKTDPNLAGTEREYRFVGSGADLAESSSVFFNWLGKTQYNTPIGQTTDAGPPEVITAPSVYLVNSQWEVHILRPTKNGFTARAAEIRIRKDSDNTIYRQQDVGNVVTWLVPPPGYDAKVDYRWINDYRSEVSDGWSAWSTPLLVTTTPAAPPPVGTGGDPEPEPGGGGRPGCFIDDTEVLMADWTVRKIQTVMRGDHIMSWMENRIFPGIVAGTENHKTDKLHRIEAAGSDLLSTPRHPFEAGWHTKRQAKQLVAGKSMVMGMDNANWTGYPVTTSEQISLKKKVRVSNFEVAEVHRYFVRSGPDGPWIAVYNNKSPYEEMA